MIQDPAVLNGMIEALKKEVRDKDDQIRALTFQNIELQAKLSASINATNAPPQVHFAPSAPVLYPNLFNPPPPVVPGMQLATLNATMPPPPNRVAPVVLPPTAVKPPTVVPVKAPKDPNCPCVTFAEDSPETELFTMQCRSKGAAGGVANITWRVKCKKCGNVFQHRLETTTATGEKKVVKELLS